MYEVLEHDELGWTAWTVPFKSESTAWDAIESTITESLRLYYAQEVDSFKLESNFKVQEKASCQ